MQSLGEANSTCLGGDEAVEALWGNSTTEDNIIAHMVLVQQNSFRGRSRLIIVACEDSEGVM